MKSFIHLYLLIACFAFTNLYSAPRGSSAPYISGDTFRLYCDFTWDENSKNIDPNAVQDGNTIFVRTDDLGSFFGYVHPYINSRYILLTHNGDLFVPREFAHYLDDPYIIAWFGQNIEGYAHPKLFNIPIGLANKQWPHGNVDIVDEVIQIAPQFEKNILLYMNIQVGTFIWERGKVFEMFKDQPYCYTSSIKGFREYLLDLCQSKFVLCPRGNGIDTHRTWETLLMGAYPIVKTSSLDPLYVDLPVVIVNDWTEINEEFLLEKYEEMKSKTYNINKAYVDYWFKFIDSFKPQ